MIEQGIYFALGCIITALAALMFAPVFWSRALRLTRKRLQLQVPLSMQEILAERDQLRAEFAVERLRVEQDLARVQGGKARDMAEIGRRSMDTTRLTDDLAAVRLELAARDEVIEKLRSELAARDEMVEKLRSELAARDEVVERLRSDLAARDQVIEKQRSELHDLEQAQRAASLILPDVQSTGEAGAATGAGDGQEHTRALKRALTAAEETLAEARDREKSIHLQNGLKAEKSRVADRDAARRIDALQAENTALQGALETARRGLPAAGTLPDDAGLRESIHALGIAVAAMSRDGAQHADEPPKGEAKVHSAFFE